MYLRALTSIAGLLLACSANAQTIYKCPQPDGTYAYTDVKCTGPHAAVVELTAQPDLGGDSAITAVTPAELSRMSLAELYDRIELMSARERQALAEVRREREANGTRRHATLPDPDAGLGGKTWESRLLVVHTQLRQMVDEIRRRCPGGAAMSPRGQSCGT